MAAIKSVSRKTIIVAVVVIACAAAGAAWGWHASKVAARESVLARAQKMPKQDAVFVLPPHPPMAPDQPQEEVLANLADSRIWEVTARQPLPPRKEPLTAPGWKIVGVTSVGDETSVLLLFDKQTTTEARKVGDLLPGGAKIVQITQDALRIVLNSQYMKLSVRKQ